MPSSEDEAELETRVREALDAVVLTRNDLIANAALLKAAALRAVGATG